MTQVETPKKPPLEIKGSQKLPHWLTEQKRLYCPFNSSDSTGLTLQQQLFTGDKQQA